MKFDVIIGNPPYQVSDGGGTGDRAKPIYHLFVEQAKKLRPKYVSMIIPSRWMKGGKGLDSFRKDMIQDTKLKNIVDFEDAKQIFTEINLDGGVCYFLWDNNHNNELEYTYHPRQSEKITSKRFLKTDFSEMVIRDPRQISIIQKTSGSSEKMSSIVSLRNPFGFNADVFNKPENYPDIKVKTTGAYKIWGVKGIKGGAKRVSGFIDRSLISQNIDSADSYKLFFSKAYMTTATVPPKIILAEPKTLCTETFLQIGKFKDRKSAENCLHYITTKFFRALLFFNRHSLNISKSSFDLIPMQDFNKRLTDKELYEKYNITEQEQEYIEQTIAPMEIENAKS